MISELWTNKTLSFSETSSWFSARRSKSCFSLKLTYLFLFWFYWLCSVMTMSLTFLGVISFVLLLYEYNCTVQVRFVSSLSLANSILYKAVTTWLQEELNPGVNAQKEINISDASVNKMLKLCFLSLILWDKSQLLYNFSILIAAHINFSHRSRFKKWVCSLLHCTVLYILILMLFIKLSLGSAALFQLKSIFYTFYNLKNKSKN